MGFGGMRVSWLCTHKHEPDILKIARAPKKPRGMCPRAGSHPIVEQSLPNESHGAKAGRNMAFSAALGSGMQASFPQNGSAREPPPKAVGSTR